jgi:putative membrane protein
MLRISTMMVALAWLSALGQAQQVHINQDGRPERIFRPVSGLDKVDVNFLRQASVANQFEIRSSEIARMKASGEFTKEFAKEMIDDHKFADDQTVQTAQGRGVDLPSGLPQPMEHELKKLANLSGWQFDHEYRAAQKQGHEAAIHLYKGEIQNGHDQNVKALAVELLPTVEMHYRMLLSKKTMMGSTAARHGE